MMVHVTDDMIRAGLEVLWSQSGSDHSFPEAERDMVEQIFVAMVAVQPLAPDGRPDSVGVPSQPSTRESTFDPANPNVRIKLAVDNDRTSPPCWSCQRGFSYEVER